MGHARGGPGAVVTRLAGEPPGRLAAAVLVGAVGLTVVAVLLQALLGLPLDDAGLGPVDRLRFGTGVLSLPVLALLLVALWMSAPGAGWDPADDHRWLATSVAWLGGAAGLLVAVGLVLHQLDVHDLAARLSTLLDHVARLAVAAAATYWGLRRSGRWPEERAGSPPPSRLDATGPTEPVPPGRSEWRPADPGWGTQPPVWPQQPPTSPPTAGR